MIADYRYQVLTQHRVILALVLIGLCAFLSACGNKGDLYLEELELSEEQQQLLDDLEDERLKKKRELESATE